MKVFGKKPSGQRLQKIAESKNFENGAFKNINPTPQLREGATTFTVAKDFFFKKKPEDIKPSAEIPSLKTDLTKVASDVPLVVWFGHSSYLIKHQEKTFLIDPVFSGHASPFSPFVKSFTGTDVYGVNDMPYVDYLIITHDHYDHLDFETIMGLKNKFGHIYTALGVGAHLESWGFSPEQFTEMDWWQTKTIDAQKEFVITATPSRHFSGRDFDRNKTLWNSFVLQLGSYRLFIGGDSGYDDQFKVIGEKFGGFDLAFLECGQYNKDWPFIHMFPEQTAQAAADLKAKYLFPVHWGKFILSDHGWHESIERVEKAASALHVKLTTPQIGEVIYVGKTWPNRRWWQGLK